MPWGIGLFYRHNGDLDLALGRLGFFRAAAEKNGDHNENDDRQRYSACLF
jgi:hypothetical protein